MDTQPAREKMSRRSLLGHAATGVAAAAAMSFVIHWQEFLKPLIYPKLDTCRAWTALRYP